MSVTTTLRRSTAVLLLSTVVLAGCGSAGSPTGAGATSAAPAASSAASSTASPTPVTATSATDGSAAGGSVAAVGYPLVLQSPFGQTTLQARPTKVAVVSSVDLDVALALGVVPVISPRYGDAALDPWETDALAELGAPELVTYDSTDGTDFEAIAAAAPDVILATSGWTLDVDYAQLSAIAPVVSFQGADGLASMSWADRTREAAAALDLTAQGEAAVDGVDDAFAAAAAAHPEFAGKTITYAVLHPEQITYISYAGSDLRFFPDLGFTQPAAAAQFSEAQDAVSRENVDLLDADVLLVGYPFGDDGLMTQAAFEADPLFQKIPAVAGGHYAVVGDDVASPLAYPTPLSQAWVLQQLLPVLATAVAGS